MQRRINEFVEKYGWTSSAVMVIGFFPLLAAGVGKKGFGAPHHSWTIIHVPQHFLQSGEN
jgi:hypothetical protein